MFQPCIYNRHHDPALRVPCAQDEAAGVLQLGPDDWTMVMSNKFHCQDSCDKCVVLSKIPLCREAQALSTEAVGAASSFSATLDDNPILQVVWWLKKHIYVGC